MKKPVPPHVPENERSVVKSVGRVFEVLEAFNDVRKPLAAIEIAKRLDYPPSSTAALLKSMVQLGYLSFERAGRTYFPTVRIAIISEYLHGVFFGKGKLMALMGDMHSQIGETIILGTRNDLDVQYVHSIPGIYPIMLNVPPGTLRPLCGSGMGWALLSGYDNTEIRAIVDRVNRSATDKPVDVDDLLSIVEEVRVIGYARSYGTYIAGSGIIAMALPTASADRPVVVGAGGPVDRLQAREREIVRLMRSAIARHLSPT
ncbi:helix-turn-helix domain-containing protein [Vineibacter terrae]|uniref:Helix-turn-helix domain-containing protein n=1 Tax=Vineibacter terrae TaxID=2586908 RepID=A0A5C8PEU2_9HYPH|nr:helix-turn-helix domain-containing protein [Vineibacter terrae]TXL72311.1 helix-turn-helix domain-containing protein [Vineibacter terrae]